MPIAPLASGDKGTAGERRRGQLGAPACGVSTLTGLRPQRAQKWKNDLCTGITGSLTGGFHLRAHVGRTQTLQPTATCVCSSLASAFGRA